MYLLSINYRGYYKYQDDLVNLNNPEDILIIQAFLEKDYEIEFATQINSQQ